MEFLNPNVFYMMLIPLILLFLLIITSKVTVEKHFTKQMMEKLKVGNQFLSKDVRNVLFFIILILFIIALSRPVIDKKEQNVKQTLIPLVIALDVSTSMLAEDIYPNRISLGKKKLQQIIDLANNTTVGIVLFAKDSFILSPVTEDFVSLKFIVQNLNTDLNFLNGSNIYSTLEATKHMLLDYKVKNLIILSDGGNDNEYKEELEFALNNDIVIYSIGLATKNGAPMPKDGAYITNSNGDIVTVKLNESIKKISLQSGGGYIDYTLDNEDVNAILNRINIQSKKEELNIQKVKIYTELFYYPLSLGIFLLLLSLSSLPSAKKSNTTKSLFFICLLSTSFIFPTKTLAYTFNFEHIKNASEAYNNKEYEKASAEYRSVNTSNESLYNLGNSLYKEAKYKDAIDVYSKIVTKDNALESKKLHNLGNSYVKMNDLEKAKEFYEKSLKVKEDKETQENLDLVNKELEKQKKEQKKNDKNQDNKQDNKQDKKDQNKSEDSKKENQENNKNKEENKDQKKENEKKSEKSKKEKNENNKKQDNKQDKKDANKDEHKTSQNNDIKKKDQLSDMEEKKWMKMLKNQQTPVYMQKVRTNKESNNDENQPW